MTDFGFMVSDCPFYRLNSAAMVLATLVPQGDLQRLSHGTEASIVQHKNQVNAFLKKNGLFLNIISDGR